MRRATKSKPGTKAADAGNGNDLKAGPIGDQPRRPTGDMTGDQPDAKFAGKAGEMQLEEFKKKVDRKMLDELKMTEQEYAEFLRAYEAMVKRQKAQADKNDRERGSASGRSAANYRRQARAGRQRQGERRTRRRGPTAARNARRLQGLHRGCLQVRHEAQRQIDSSHRWTRISILHPRRSVSKCGSHFLYDVRSRITRTARRRAPVARRRLHGFACSDFAARSSANCAVR